MLSIAAIRGTRGGRSMHSERWLTLHEVADLLGVSYATALRVVQAGKLRAVNVAASSGRATYRVTPADLAAYREQQAVRDGDGGL
jgi:excisionase family DNA binding protein